MKAGQPVNVTSEHDAENNHLENQIHADPDCAQAHAELGVHYYQKQELEQALKHLEHAVRLEPGKTDYHKSLADFYYTVLSRNDDALAEYLQVLKLDPFDTEANIIAGNLMVVQHRFDEAQQLYQNLLNIEPWRGDVQVLIDAIVNRSSGKVSGMDDERHRQAQNFAEEGQGEAAIRLLEEIIAENPMCAVAHNDLGVLRHQAGDIAVAGEHYEKAVSIEADNIIFTKNLAEYRLYVNGETEKALELYVRILKARPQDVDALMAAGDISAHFLRLDDARMFYEAVLDAEPWNLSASQRISHIEAGI